MLYLHSGSTSAWKPSRAPAGATQRNGQVSVGTQLPSRPPQQRRAHRDGDGAREQPPGVLHDRRAHVHHGGVGCLAVGGRRRHVLAILRHLAAHAPARSGVRTWAPGALTCAQRPSSYNRQGSSQRARHSTGGVKLACTPLQHMPDTKAATEHLRALAQPGRRRPAAAPTGARLAGARLGKAHQHVVTRDAHMVEAQLRSPRTPIS